VDQSDREETMGRLKRHFIVLWTAIALSACGGALPFTALTDADRSRLAAALQSALEHNRTGEAANWSSPETGRRGIVVPLRTYKDISGRDCREFQQTATVEGETDITFGAACRDADGVWRIVSAPSHYHPRYSGWYYPDTDDFGYGVYYGYPPYRYPYWRYYRR
jgi:surface antigen